jgi:hypothetical protein
MAFNASTDFNLNAAMSTVGSPNVSYATNLTGIARPAQKPALRYRYPQKSIGKDDDYLEINVIEYVPPGTETGKNNLKLKTGTETNSNQRALSTIQLPIPANIGDTNQVNWGDDTLNPLAALGAEKAGEILKSGDFGRGAIDAAKSIGSTGMQVLTKGGGQGLVVNQFISALVNSVANGSVDPKALLSRAEGNVLNPNLELLFGGVNLRSFSFDFDFAPRNLEESNVVKQIIRIFKQSMAPKTGSNTSGAGLFIKAPNVFLLKYKTGSRDHPYLNKFKPCALTNMGMNYTGSGSYATYADKTPVHMKLSLNFTELNPIYNEDYESDVGKQAVGY